MRQNDFGRRGRAGKRRHRASVIEHNGNQDDHGGYTFADPEDYQTIVTGYPVELITTGGDERVRGRQLIAETTHVMYGEYHGGKSITSEMKVKIEGVTYEVIAAYDPQGDKREMRVEMKRES